MPKSATELELKAFVDKINSVYKGDVAGRGKVLKAFQLARFSSGILDLDIKLGGGWPFGRICTIAGQYSTGKTALALKAAQQIERYCHNCHQFGGIPIEGIMKMQRCKCGDFVPGSALFVDLEGCITGDSVIFDPVTGIYHTIKEVVDEKLQINVQSTTKEGKSVIGTVTNWFNNGFKPVKRILFKSGESLKLTDNHLVQVIRKDRLEWVRTDNLTCDDWVARPRNIRESQTDKKYDPDFIRFIGYMLGDGYFCKKGSMNFTNVDSDIICDFRRICNKFNAKAVQCDDRHHRISGIKKANQYYPLWLKEECGKLGLLGCTGNKKHIPEEIWNQPNELLKELVVGLIMTDGAVNICRPTISFCNISRELVNQLRMLLRRFNIHSSVHAGFSDDCYHLSVNGHEIIKFARHFKLFGYKGKQLEHWVKELNSCLQEKRTQGVQFLPNKKKYNRTVNDYELTFSKIISIEQLGEQEVYDITVDKYHNFTCNDFIVHNSFSMDWSIANGWNPEWHTIVRPETAEQAIDITNAAIRENIFDLIIIDSIAAMTPSKEISDSSEDWQMGLAARLVNKAMRTWCASLIKMTQQYPSKGGPCIISLNQLRQTMVLMGDNRVLPAGKGQEFASSVIIYTKPNKVEAESSDKVTAYANLCGLTKKNKTYVPNLEYSCTMALRDIKDENDVIIMKKGEIDNPEQLIKMGKDYNIVKKIGAGIGHGVISLNSEKAFKAEIRKRPELARAIWIDIIKAACDIEFN